MTTVLRMFHSEEGSVKVMSPSQGCVKRVSHLVQLGTKHCSMDSLQGVAEGCAARPGCSVCVQARYGPSLFSCLVMTWLSGVRRDASLGVHGMQ